MLFEDDQAPAPPRAFVGLPGMVSLGLVALLVLAFPFSIGPTAAPSLNLSKTSTELSQRTNRALTANAGSVVAIDVTAMDLNALHDDAFGDRPLEH